MNTTPILHNLIFLNDQHYYYNKLNGASIAPKGYKNGINVHDFQGLPVLAPLTFVSRSLAEHNMCSTALNEFEVKSQYL